MEKLAEQKSVSCRLAGCGDAVVLADFARRTFETTYRPLNRAEDIESYLAESFGIDLLHAALKNPDIEIVLCHVNNELAGYARLRRSAVPDCVDSQNQFEIERFYLDQPWHGGGVAAILMNAVFDTARAGQIDGLWLGVWEKASRAIAFYRKCGFNRVGEHEFRLGSALQTDHIMTRSISKDSFVS